MVAPLEPRSFPRLEDAAFPLRTSDATHLEFSHRESGERTVQAVTLGVLVSLPVVAMLTSGQFVSGAVVGTLTWWLVIRHIRRSAVDRVRIDAAVGECVVERTGPDGANTRRIPFDQIRDVELADRIEPKYAKRGTSAMLAFVLRDETRVYWSRHRWFDPRVLHEIPRLALATIREGRVPGEVPPLASGEASLVTPPPLPAIFPILGYLGVGLLGLGLWGTGTAVGRRMFDEMAGIIPLVALWAGTGMILAFVAGRAVHAMRSRHGR